MITTADFTNWKQDPVTKALFEAIEGLVEDTKEALVLNSDNGQYSDDFYRGYIFALRDVREANLSEESGNA